nr:hypothetical protein [Allomuricauda sp.]
MKIFKLPHLVLMVLTACVISCSGEDGEQGLQGITGENGINCWDLDGDGEGDLGSEDINNDGKVNVLDCMGMVGDVGENGANCWDLDGDGEGNLELEDINGDGKVDALDCRGADGNDIEVFDDFTDYGSITVDLEGTRPDGVPFEDNLELELVGTLSSNEIRDFQGNGYDQIISIIRYLPLGNNGSEDVRAGFSLFTQNLGENPQAIRSARFNIRHYIFGNDNKYFVLDASFNLFDLNGNNNEQDGTEVGTSNVEVTDVVYDDATQRLSFSYSFIGAAANNSSNHDLNVSGTVDVVLFERIT